MFHWDLAPQSKWEMFILKSDPYKGIALLKNSIPIKLSLNREMKEVAPGSAVELAWLGVRVDWDWDVDDRE